MELLALVYIDLLNWLQRLRESIIIDTVMLVDSVTFIIQMIDRMVSVGFHFELLHSKNHKKIQSQLAL